MGGNPNATNSLGQTPLFWAIANDRPRALQRLLQRGANPLVTDQLGQTPLLLAEAMERVTMVEAIRKHIEANGMLDEKKSEPKTDYNGHTAV
jgi:ankyrin repeat protein